MREQAKRSCFIIMPIATPPHLIERYRGDTGHFTKVLKGLFLPSVEEAGFHAIPPSTGGSDNVQATIVKNLDEAELVLCDLSAFNPNVFFELGIRTAFNKPVCLVKDDISATPPFDVANLHYQEYQSFPDWDQPDDQRHALTQHIEASYETNPDTNALWKYFGIRAAATAYPGDTGLDAKVNILIDSLAPRLVPRERGDCSACSEVTALMRRFLKAFLPGAGVGEIDIQRDQSTAVAVYSKYLDCRRVDEVKIRFFEVFGYKLDLEHYQVHESRGGTIPPWPAAPPPQLGRD